MTPERLAQLNTLPSDKLAKEMFNGLVTLMHETEKLLQENASLKRLNKIVLEEIAYTRKKNYFGKDEYNFIIEMLVDNQMKYENEIYSFKRLGQLKGGFKHESPF